MKINIRTNMTFAAIAGLLLLTSCANSEEYGFPASDKPVVTAGETTFNLAEGESIIIPLALSEPINEPITLKLEIMGGTADKSDYFAGEAMSGDWGNPDTGYEVIIPAYAESFEIPVSALVDLVPQEGTETLELRLDAAGNRNALTSEGGILFTFNIEEVESDNFVMRLEWDETYTDSEGEQHSFCDFDLDLEIYAVNTGALVATSYASCPEEIMITPGDLPDGDYLLVPSYYSPAGAAVPVDYTGIPAVLTLAKPGVFAEIYDFSTIWTDFTAGVDEGNPAGYQPVANLNISGTTYTLTDVNTGELIVQGRNVDFASFFKGRK